ncbi:UNVERIFIED_CONTAM: hypothetical protein RMT77_002076 [Armadillidium vulgare]|nr:hypothetical protein Avbf_09469 [Armadillidium vulgare]
MDGKTNVTPTDIGEDFSSLNLSEISPVKKNEKKPKKILHFSDGVLEEYSSDEETDTPACKPPTDDTDPASLTWKPWMAHWATKTGKNVLSTCDYIGEGLANFLGITSQKYFYEIEEYKRCLKQEEEERKEEAAQMAGWTTEPSITEESNIHDVEEQFFEKKFEFKKETFKTEEIDKSNEKF